jgi:hypothetical protein
MSDTINSPHYRRELGDGLVARWSSAADVEQIGDLYAYVFRDKLESPLNLRMGKWAQDLGSGRRPGVSSSDFAVVEDTRAGTIVAALVVLQQQWRYADIPFTIGRPEAVVTHPEYRNRGLVRALFELLHARSAARSDLAQAITGIGYFYRQFGYEYAVDLDGSKRLPITLLPELKKDASEPYALRRATVADLDLLRGLYERECRNPLGQAPLVTTPFDQDWWHWMLEGQNPESGQGDTAFVISDTAGEPQGYVLGGRLRWGETYPIFGFSTREGAPLLTLVPSVLRALKPYAEQTNPWRDEGKALKDFSLRLGAVHQVYDVLPRGSVAGEDKPYAWYVRVPDLPAFMRHIAPALERQLASGPAAGYSGEFKLDFYRDGLRLGFEHGRLQKVEPWRRQPWEEGAQAGFPPLVFLQLLFGRRSLSELQHAFPDVWADDECSVVLNSLFPKRHSWAVPQD